MTFVNKHLVLGFSQLVTIRSVGHSAKMRQNHEVPSQKIGLGDAVNFFINAGNLLLNHSVDQNGDDNFAI